MLKRLMRWAGVLATVTLVAACGGGGGGGDSLFEPDDGASAPGGGNGGGGGGPVSDVSNGVPSQRSMSISIEKYNLDWSMDGDTTSVSVRVTDTAGNPVPDGTQVQFSTEGGQIQTSCALSGVSGETANISECSVTFATQNVRPTDGLVSIVAWLAGQEAFIDADGDGHYDAGEPFYDTGRLFRDDNETGSYETDFDELNVGASVSSAPGLGTSVCGPTGTVAANPAVAEDFGFDPSNEPLSAGATCDGVWGRSLVRANVVLPLSDPRYLAGEYSAGSLRVFTALPSGVEVAAPAGTTISVLTTPADCTINISPATVLENAIGPTLHTVTATGVGCSGQNVQFKLTFEGNEELVPATLP